MNRKTMGWWIGCLLGLAAAPSFAGVVTNFWVGAADSDWMNPANWTGSSGIVPTGVVSETRMEVRHTASDNELVYREEYGVTVLAGTNLTPRSVMIGHGPSFDSQLRITGGTLEGRGNSGNLGAADIIGGNGGTGRLVIDGGTYLRTNDIAGSESGAEMVIGYQASGSNTRGELIVSNGLASIRHMRLNHNNAASVTAIVSLQGGALETYAIRSGGTAGVQAVYFNGGVLRAGFANQVDWISNTITGLVQDGGAVFDTVGYTCGLAAHLTPDGASTGGVTKIGTGSLRLSGINTYTGGTVVDAGALVFARPLSLPGYPAAVDLNLAAGTALGVGVASNEWSTADVDLLLASNAAVFVAGTALAFDTTAGNGTNGSAIGIAGLNLRKMGANTLTLTGSNSHTGLTTVTGGALCIENGGALGTTDGGTVVNNGTRLELNGGIVVAGETITIVGNGGSDSMGALRSVGGTNEWAGPIALGANQSRIAAVSGDLVVSGPIGDNGSKYDLLIRGPDGNLTNVVTLSGASTYGGRTLIFQNYVKLDGGDNRLPVTTVVSLGIDASGHRTVGWLDLNGRNQELAGLELHASVVDPFHAASQLVTNGAPGLSRLTLNTFSNFVYRGEIAGNLEVVKTGAGTMAFAGTDTYAGATTVSGGVLRIDGSHTGGGAVTVLPGATLGGTGTVAGAVSVADGGTLSPGASAGTFTLNGGLTLSGLSRLDFELGAASDLLVVSGGLTLGGRLRISDAGGLAEGTYTLIQYDGALAGAAPTIESEPDGFDCAVDTTNQPGEVRLVVSVSPLSPFEQWQVLYFGGTNEPNAAAAADPDGDGSPNDAEFGANTNPTNALSALKVTQTVRNGTDVLLTWTTAGVRTNRVQAGSDLMSTNFTDLGGPIVLSEPGDATTNYLDAGGATNVPARFYRIRVEP